MPSLQSPAEPVLHPDPENVAHVAQVARYQVQAAIGVIAPANRQLLDPVSQAARDGQDLDVEHIAVDLLPPEQLLGHGVLKELETALRVLDAGKSHHGLHEPMEPFRAHAAVERLLLFDDRTPAACPDGEVGAGGKRGTKFVELVDGYFVVGVGVTDDRALGKRDGVAYSQAFATSLFAADRLERRIGFRHAADDFARAVVPVRGHDDLVAYGAGVEVTNGLTHRGRDHARFVVSRKNQADIGRHSGETCIVACSRRAQCDIRVWPPRNISCLPTVRAPRSIYAEKDLVDLRAGGYQRLICPDRAPCRAMEDLGE